MERFQGSLEYLIIIAAVLAVATIVVFFLSGSLSGTHDTAQFAKCKEAASSCYTSHLLSPNDPCIPCNTACIDNKGNDLLAGTGYSAIELCKHGKPAEIYPRDSTVKEEDNEEEGILRDISIINVLYNENIEPEEIVYLEIILKNSFNEIFSNILLTAEIWSLDGSFLASSDKQITLFSQSKDSIIVSIGAFSCRETYDIIVKLDPENLIEDINQTNNIFKFSITPTGDKECYCNTECDDDNYWTENYCENNICLHRSAIEPKGEIKVLVFEVKPDNFYDRENMVCCFPNMECTTVDSSMFNEEYCDIYSTTELFNNENPMKFMPSIYDVKKWYENQADLYDVTDFSVEINLAGPFVSERFEYGFVVNPEVTGVFKNLLAEKGYNKEDYDIIHYVYFDDFGINPETQAAGFRSFADRYGPETFNSITEGTTGIKTIIHEMGHIFNADDLYEGFICLVPNGIPEPEKDPLYPQTKACLMCGSIMTGENTKSEVNILHEELTLCDYTAKQFRWID